MGRLNDLGVMYKTDKSSLYHGYLDFYEEKIKEFLKSPPNIIVEIGIKDGASLMMWRDFFPEAIIVGVDIQHTTRIPGVHCYQFDAYDESEWYKRFSGISHFSICVEDGSHRTSDQLKAWDIINRRWFQYYDSLFIMEDIHTSFLGDYVDTEQTTYQYLKQRQAKMDGVDFFQKDKDIFHDSMTAIITK